MRAPVSAAYLEEVSRPAMKSCDMPDRPRAKIKLWINSRASTCRVGPNAYRPFAAGYQGHLMLALCGGGPSHAREGGARAIAALRESGSSQWSTKNSTKISSFWCVGMRKLARLTTGVA